MIHKRALLFSTTLALCACGPQQSEELSSPLFTNGGFETGTFANWTKSTFLNTTGLAAVPPTTTAQLQLAAGGTDFTFALTNAVPQSQLFSSGAAPPTPTLTAGPGVPEWPRFGMTSVAINQDGATNPAGKANHQGANQNVNSIKQSMATTAADIDPADGKVHVRFVLAPELEAAGHPPTQQPYFFAILRNLTPPRNGDLFTNFNFANQPGVPWSSQGAGATALLFTDWQIFDIAPADDKFIVGDTLEVEVYASGCQPGGHSGTAYVDGFGAILPSLAISKTAPTSANIDTDITYTFVVENNTSGVAPNVKADEVLPPNTTYVSSNAPGAVCVTPPVGGTGTVSCTYGWMNPGASATFTVTVHNFKPSSSGTATGGAAAQLTDTSQAWPANAWQGFTVFISAGTGAGQQRIIGTNTATQLNVTANWVTVPDATSVYKIVNPPLVKGTATAGGAATLTDSTAAWGSNQWLSYNVTILAGTGAGQQAAIRSNTPTILTVAPAWTTVPDATSVYAIGLPVASIVNGNYGVQGVTVTRLLGPKRETLITSGVAFADLSITKSDATPAVTWGGSTTYTITVTNNGPATATNALVKDTFPAQLATHNWTCAPAAACTTASGAGNINNTVTLAAGKSATFTVNATIIAGGPGNGTVTNVATVTAPGGVVDNFPDNNASADQDGISPPGTLRALNVTKDPTGSGQGTVISSPAAINCGPGCPNQSASFADSTVVTLHAVAQPFNTFLGWGGDCLAAGNAPTCTLTMSAARNVTVLFTACGNGILDATEGCDDGNFTNGDGCNSSCKVEDTFACNATAPGLLSNASCASGICDTKGYPAPGKCEPVGACGNGILDAGEGCDDGNVVSGDGCSATCKVENTFACNATAPGLLSNASCASGICDTKGYPAPGKCEPVGACGNGILDAGEGCDDGNVVSGDGCSATCKVENTFACNATAPGLVGNASCASGVCNSTGFPAPGKCAPANACGNGKLEAGEGCDDGNLINGDGCDSMCKVENTFACNANVAGAVGNASCESGVCNASGFPAPGKCAPANACGNGKLEAGEGCDDGNLVNGDGCDSMCKVENTFACNANVAGAVGNASCESGVCNASGFPAPGKCAPANACGNGKLEAGEGCDDGNLVNGDGCDSMCKVENTFACNANVAGAVGDASCESGVCNASGFPAPGKCAPANACGNGKLEAGEGCDDGNVVGGDGCSATCKVENTFACNATAPGLVGSASCVSGICDTKGYPAPGKCEAANACGNGVLDAGEGCDDGNTVSGDGCDAMCKIESSNPCNASAPGLMGDASCASGVCDVAGGAPGVCAPANTCGNGKLDAGEGCDDGNLVNGDGCDSMCKIEDGKPCNASAPGATGDGSCESGHCDVTAGAPGVCNPLGCNTDSDCPSGKWCNESQHACTPRLPNGSPVPTDGPHSGPTLNGLCTMDAAALVCASGVCDAHDNACGLLDGSGPCTAANAGTVCRSGMCDSNGVCGPGSGPADDGGMVGSGARYSFAGGGFCSLASPRTAGGDSLLMLAAIAILLLAFRARSAHR